MTQHAAENPVEDVLHGRNAETKRLHGDEDDQEKRKDEGRKGPRRQETPRKLLREPGNVEYSETLLLFAMPLLSLYLRILSRPGENTETKPPPAGGSEKV